MKLSILLREGCVQPFYEGAPHIEDIAALLAEYGFILIGDNTETWQADELQGDYFFAKQ